MKKFFALLLASAMMFSLFSCSVPEADIEKDSETVDNVEGDAEDVVETVENSATDGTLNSSSEKVSDEKAVEEEPTEVVLEYLHASKSTGESYGRIFTWLPKNEKATKVDTEIEFWPLHGGQESYTAFYIYNAVPQIKDKSDDSARINSELSDFMNSLGKDPYLYCYISGFTYGIMTVLAVDNSAVTEPNWYNFAYDVQVTESQINMKEYFADRGVPGDDVIAAVEESAYLLEFTDVPDGVTAEIRYEFDGDYCVMLTDQNTAMLRYAVVYTSDSEESIPFNSGWVTFDLEPRNSAAMDGFSDIFTWFSDDDYTWATSAVCESENLLKVYGCLPLLKSDSEDAKKLNAQMVYYQYGLLHSLVYRAPNGLVYVCGTYETTCHGTEYPTYVYDTVNDKTVSVYDFLVSIDFDFEGLYNAVAEKYVDRYDSELLEFKFDESGDWNIYFINENEVFVYYVVYYNGNVLDLNSYITFEF